ncbi:MAG: LysR family transcriptional regulator [Halieaceae bacterium]|nr:LysR family transcriptional regulator [Halieaceae bacterium]
MDWDDMKVLLALSRKGSARGAAQELGVSNSTVTRRLDEMERNLHTQLFDRTPDGYRMTGSAEQMLPTAEHVEELMLAAERKFSGGNQQLEGSIRLTMPDVSGMGYLIQRLADFAREYPRIDLEILPGIQSLDLSRREADIAIRVLPANERPPEQLIGRHLSPISMSAYVHRSLLNPDDPSDVSHLSWVGWIGQHALDEEWLSKTDYPQRPIRHSMLNFNMMVEALQARMGMAWVPCFTVFHAPDIVRIPGATIVPHADMWVLTHRDLRLSARLRTVREIIAEETAKIAHQIDTRPRSSSSS